MPDPRTMSVRQFLRGGYKEPGQGPIIVTSGDEIAFVAFPGLTAIKVEAHALMMAHGKNGVVVTDPVDDQRRAPAAKPSAHDPQFPAVAFHPVPKPSARPKAHR